MLFNSYIFIFLFLPLVLGGFYLLKKIKQYTLAKVFLIGMSLWFYGYFNPSYLVIILASVFINYVIYLLIEKSKKKKVLLIIGVLFNVGLLFYFKYFNFFIDNINIIFKTDITVCKILLPLGISFFTFQQISFIVDAYKGEIKNYSPIDYALFVTFFPQLIAGPIVSHDEMMPQISGIKDSKFNSEMFAKGIFLFVLGLAKKVLIADVFGGAVDWGYGAYQTLSSENSLLLMIFYSFQIYFDFSGYCDMAKGIAAMFMIELPLNFDSPYKSENVIVFWKTWHITLGRFLTKYIYIPLGGNKKGKCRQYINVLLVFFISGIWHGAGWTFLVWGILHGIMQVLARVALPLLSKIPKVINKGLTFICVSIAWIFFRSESIKQATGIIKSIFRFKFTSLSAEMASFFARDEFTMAMKLVHIDRLPYSSYFMMIIYSIVAIVLIFACPNVEKIADKSKAKPISAVLLSFLLLWCVISLSQVSTFLYFNF